MPAHRRRLDLTMGLVHRPSLLFLDEPTTGLDPRNRANLWDPITGLREQSGMTIVLMPTSAGASGPIRPRGPVRENGVVSTDGLLDKVPDLRVLPQVEWRARARAHRERLDRLVGPYLERRAAGTTHPVVDFLFTYYGNKPSQLRRWHPGFGIGLPAAHEYAGARGYHRVGGESPEKAVYTADPAYLVKRRDTIEFVNRLLTATARRPAQLSCFGLHEWAMVYRTDAVRHQQVPLRLGHAGTDAVVESMSLRCTHFDAFRFFTPDAVGRNAEPLTREGQLDREQPGCLHANMDLYKWGFKLAPLIPSGLLLDCFELACTARELDMRASPYDLREYGYEPVRIETPGGRAEYVRAQAAVAEDAEVLRVRLRRACAELTAALRRVEGQPGR